MADLVFEFRAVMLHQVKKEVTEEAIASVTISDIEGELAKIGDQLDSKVIRITLQEWGLIRV